MRGPLTTGPQLLTTLGLVVGFFTCYGTENIDSSLSWRLPFILLSCLSGVFATASLLWLVASPRWLTLRGRGSEASAAWDILGVGYAEREKAEMQQTQQGAVELDSSADNNSTDRQDVPLQNPQKERGFLDVFSQDVRTRTFLAVFMMGMQQLSGIDGVLYVSSEIRPAFIHLD
jgi:DNA-directed RNA polymerase III subunit RPC2